MEKLREWWDSLPENARAGLLNTKSPIRIGDAPPTTYGMAWVHLGDKEWGNETMERVAREMANGQFADTRPLVLEVCEHGGWFLTYYFDERHDALCVNSANDSARFSAEVHQVWAGLRQMERNHLGQIRR